jgi:hypothetical protein
LNYVGPSIVDIAVLSEAASRCPMNRSERGDPMMSDALRPFRLALLFRGSALAVILSASAVAQTAGGSGHPTGGQTGEYGAPEIDPKIASAGIVLLVGGLLVLTGRRRAASSPTSKV